MIQLINEQRLGFVATVGSDGTPNLSPKGTMVVVDDEHIAFGNIRSPKTVSNLANQPIVEINFVDPFTRKGFRFKGDATYARRNEPRFEQLLPMFDRWDTLVDKIVGIVVVKISSAKALTTPAYDVGATEDDLKTHWAKHFSSIGSLK